MEYIVMARADGGGRVIIPKSMRDIVGIKPDEQLQMMLGEDKKTIILKKVIDHSCPTCGAKLNN